MKSYTIALLSALAGLGPLVSIGDAEILLATGKTTPSVYGGGTYIIDFNDDAPGGTIFNFTTTEAYTTVVVMFNAEAACGGDAFHWLDVDILVNPAGAPGETAILPSNGDNAFCSGNDTDSNMLYGGDGWVSACTIGVILLRNAGTHTVRVRVDGAHCGIARLDDMSLVVMK